MTRIHLNDMEFFAFHGCYPSERHTGNYFRVSLSVEGDFSKACESDSIDDTLNYQALYRIIAQEMQVPSNLLEHLAGRIMSRIQAEFAAIQRVSLNVSKLNPPLGGKIGCVSFELSSP